MTGYARRATEGPRGTEPTIPQVGLRLPDPEHLRSASRARALSGGLPVLHGDLLGVLDLALAPALHTIGFH